MRLIKCYIENFGLLHTEEFSFNKGLNCCISDNGTGKTTLTAFIEAMLYGIGEGRKQSLDENPRKKYSPWQGGKFGGSLTIEAGKKRYTIERSFGQRPADDTFRLIETDTGKISYEYGEDIGEKLFGIDRDGFLRTVFLSEKNLQGKNDNKSISAKLSDLVGVDGDVGGFDSAIRLLEDRRKFYFKKGNTGEIANVKERINECQRRIDAIDTLEVEAAKKEERLRELKAEKERLSLLEGEQKMKLHGFQKQKERSSHEETYGAMMASLSEEKKRFSEVTEFFAKGLPSTVQIDGARDTYAEAERLKAEALEESGNEEYVSLSEFFKAGTDFVEIAEAERAAGLADEKSKEIAAIKNGFDKRSLEMRSLFQDEVPAREEIERIEKSAKGGFSVLKILLIILGLGLTVGGIIIGEIYGYAMSAIGALVAIFSLISAVKRGNSKELLSFVRKYGDGESGSAKANLDEIKDKLTRYEVLAAELDGALEGAEETYSTLTLKVCAFLEKFPVVEADSMLESVMIIKQKYTKYYAISETGEVSQSSKMTKLKRSEELMKNAMAFLSYFPTKTNEPFAEIRDRLSDYNYLKVSVARLERECDLYAVKYGVTGKIAPSDNEAESAANATLTELTERMKALSAEYALVERELNLARAEIDKKDEYEMAKAELDDLYRKHVESLEIIKKTSLCLREACDNITSKYLGKTKEKFIEYSALIAGVEGEYTLSTSFELGKTERGESHGIESYSRGTRDLYSLGLRLALVDALYEKESPFIILDDPFIALDDSKLERAKNTLKTLGKSRQILYFTCSKAREIV
ncbi:MAG: AAA family ATPase [Clostridia bacterium]|nr:AAA family ATPase [Clostridia bacterium]